MKVRAGGRNRAMAQRRLDQMNRRTVVQSVGSMRVPEPVGANWKVDVGVIGCPAEDHPDTPAIQAFATARRKHKTVRVCRAAKC